MIYEVSKRIDESMNSTEREILEKIGVGGDDKFSNLITMLINDMHRIQRFDNWDSLQENDKILIIKSVRKWILKYRSRYLLDDSLERNEKHFRLILPNLAIEKVKLETNNLASNSIFDYINNLAIEYESEIRDNPEFKRCIELIEKKASNKYISEGNIKDYSKANLTTNLVVDSLYSNEFINKSQKEPFISLIDNNFISNQINWYKYDWELIALIEYLILNTSLDIKKYNDIYDFVTKNFHNAKNIGNIKAYKRSIIMTTMNKKRKEIEEYDNIETKLKENKNVSKPALYYFTTKLDQIFNE